MKGSGFIPAEDLQWGKLQDGVTGMTRHIHPGVSFTPGEWFRHANSGCFAPELQATSILKLIFPAARGMPA
jgi:hypothetical protein